MSLQKTMQVSKTVPSTWRIIPLETHSAAKNMALDESCLEHIAQGKSPATIRFYQWNPSAVSIGYFQSLKEEVKEEECTKRSLDIVRRSTGGGAVYHDFEGEITYSILAPVDLFPKGITESYKEICGYVVSALQSLNLAASFAPINDVLVDGKKVSGNAQTRRKGVLLQHGTILYGLDVETMFSVLNVSKEKISDKFIEGVKQRVTCIKDSCSASKQEVYEALKNSFTSGKNALEGSWTESEIELAEKLAVEKYSSNEWNYWR